MYKNNYKSLNRITTALGRNVYDHVSHQKLLIKFRLNCAIPMMAPLRLSLLIKILIIGSTKLSLRNLVNRFMIVLLGLSQL
jgi:hypothetical protein